MVTADEVWGETLKGKKKRGIETINSDSIIWGKNQHTKRKQNRLNRVEGETYCDRRKKGSNEKAKKGVIKGNQEKTAVRIFWGKEKRCYVRESWYEGPEAERGGKSSREKKGQRRKSKEKV